MNRKQRRAAKRNPPPPQSSGSRRVMWRGEDGSISIGKGVDWLGRDYRRVPDDDGRHRVGPVDAVCDFCCSNPPSWEYPAARMEIIGHPAIDASDDEWAACGVCHGFLEAHDLEALIEFIVATQRRVMAIRRAEGMDMVEPPKFTEAVRRNVLRFMDARTGPPRAWTPPC